MWHSSSTSREELNHISYRLPDQRLTPRYRVAGGTGAERMGIERRAKSEDFGPDEPRHGVPMCGWRRV